MSTTPQQATRTANHTLRALYANVTDWDRALIVQAIEAIGADGEPFSMNDVRDVLPDLAHGTAGLVLHSLVRRRNPRILAKVGEVASTSPATHGKPINVYRLVGTVEKAVAA